MRFLILVSGHQPAWAERHSRNLALLLAEQGEGTVVYSRRCIAERTLPGEMPRGTRLTDDVAGLRVRVGGLSAAIGPRQKCDFVLLVVGPNGTPAVAFITAILARARGEKVLVEFQEPIGTEITRTQRVMRRLLTKAALQTVSSVSNNDESGVHTVVALCEGDAALAELMVRAFASLPQEVAAQWQLRLHTSQEMSAELRSLERAGSNVSVEAGPMDTALFEDAAVVVTGHESGYVPTVLDSTARGLTGVIVGHPLAGRVLKQGDTLWLANPDPSSILVTMEIAVGATLDQPASIDRIRSSGDQLVSVVRKLA